MKQICFEEKVALQVDGIEDRMIDQINITDFAMIVENNTSKNISNVEQSIMIELVTSLNYRAEGDIQGMVIP